MKPRDHDYSMFFAFMCIMLWMMLAVKCESSERIENELDDISHELRMMRYERS